MEADFRLETHGDRQLRYGKLDRGEVLGTSRGEHWEAEQTTRLPSRCRTNEQMNKQLQHATNHFLPPLSMLHTTLPTTPAENFTPLLCLSLCCGYTLSATLQLRCQPAGRQLSGYPLGILDHRCVSHSHAWQKQPTHSGSQSRTAHSS